MTQIWIDLEVSNPNVVSQRVDLTKESWRRSLDSDKSCRIRKIRLTDTQLQSPTESPDLLAGIFHFLQTARCSTGLNGSDPEQIEGRGWRLSLDVGWIHEYGCLFWGVFWENKFDFLIFFNFGQTKVIFSFRISLSSKNKTFR